MDVLTVLLNLLLAGLESDGSSTDARLGWDPDGVSADARLGWDPNG